MRIDTRTVLIALALSVTLACDKGAEEADKKAAAAAEEARAAQEKANTERLEAEQAAAKAKAVRDEARTKIQKDLDAHERKAASLKQKAATAKGAM
jgi:hypothetical protein